MMRRLFSSFAAFAVLFFCSVPALATGMEIGGGGAGIPIVGNINLDVVEFAEYVRGDFKYYANTVGHWIDEDVCPYAPQLGGGHNFVPRRTLVDGQVGRYHVCEYCGKSYGEELEEAYEQYVDTLPGTQVNSSGAFLWAVRYPEETIVQLFYRINSTCNEQISIYGSPVISHGYIFTPDAYQGIVMSYRGLSSYTLTSVQAVWPSFVAPWTAVYSGGSRYIEGSQFDTFRVLVQQGASVMPSGYDSFHCRPLQISYSGDFDYTFPWLSMWVEPLEGFDSTFSADTRVSATNNGGTGLYGYMDNGTLVQSAADTIFAESGNVYTNPVTLNTKTVTDWNYDYVDRSYTLTTNEGDEVTVTYGDTNVTINEGENTYNVYYLVEHDDNVQCAHTYSSQVTQSPTCTGAGVRTYTCSSCGNSYTQEIPASGHDYAANVTTAPTCSAPGVRTFTCTVCGDTYTQDIPATGHDYVSSVTQEATCTVPGVRTSVCSVCGDTHTETIPATGHSYTSEVTTAPTCTETGVRTFTCSVCGDVRTESVPATGHNYSSEITMQPTCATTGVKTFTCSECGDSYTRPVPATGHRWRILQTVPNQYDTENGGQLVQAGYTVYECDACGEQYRIDAAASGSALPMPSTGGTSTGTELMDGDTGDSVSDVGKGFLLTIANGITEDLPRVLELMSQWFTTVPALFEGYSKFLAASFGWMPPDCVMLLTFGVSTVTLIGILKAIRR